MTVEKVIRVAAENNPEIRLVLDMAARARAAESAEPPRNVEAMSEIVSIPVNSATLVPPATLPGR
jgi:hypothetical protein